jgi:NitT/TauT family transport system ATP-binding protein
VLASPVSDPTLRDAVVVDHVSMDFGVGTGAPARVLQDVSLSVPRGQFVSIIGPSGSGKTTLLRIIGTLLRPTGGSVRLVGKPADQARRDRDFAFVFQQAALLEWRDALGNVMLPLELQHVAKKTAADRAQTLLERVGLREFARHYPRQLSGGMQQRVSIARALSVEPALLLMDEPFGALDEITRDRMNFELLDLWGQRLSTVVFVTHNIREAVFLSDRVIVLGTRPGRVIGDFEIDLPRPRTRALRDSARFLELRLEGERLLEAAIGDHGQ